jgi:type II secretory pathway pseudopilin PulG
MRASRSSQSGSTLVEVVIAMGVLVVGALGTAGVFTRGMQAVTSSPGDLVATQKAAEAIESVFSARDSHTLTWAQIRNVQGQSGSDGGIFLDGPQQLKDPGPDGLVNTIDDGALEFVTFPGPDHMLNTADDAIMKLSGYTREIKITDIQTGLRNITVILTFQAGTQTRKYTLTTYISNYS